MRIMAGKLNGFNYTAPVIRFGDRSEFGPIDPAADAPNRRYDSGVTVA